MWYAPLSEIWKIAIFHSLKGAKDPWPPTDQGKILQIYGPLTSTKVHFDQCNMMPLWSEKPKKNRYICRCNTSSRPCRQSCSNYKSAGMHIMANTKTMCINIQSTGIIYCCTVFTTLHKFRRKCTLKIRITTQQLQKQQRKTNHRWKMTKEWTMAKAFLNYWVYKIYHSF